MKTNSRERGNHYNEYANSHPMEVADSNSTAAAGYLATLKAGFENVSSDVQKFGRNAKWKTITENTTAGGFAYLAAQKDNLKKHWIAGDSKEFTEVTQAADETAEAEDALCQSEGTGKLDAENGAGNFANKEHTFGQKIEALQTKCCDYMIERFSSRAKRKTTSGELRMVWVYYMEKMAEKGVDNPDNKKVQAAYSRVPIQGWESLNFQDWLSQAKVQNRRNNRAIYELTREVTTQDAMLQRCQYINIPFESWYLECEHKVKIKVGENEYVQLGIPLKQKMRNGQIYRVNEYLHFVLNFTHRYYRREGDDIIYYLHDNEVHKQNRDSVRHPNGSTFSYCNNDFKTTNSISGYPEIHFENYGFTNPVTKKKGRFILRKIPNIATEGNDTVYYRYNTIQDRSQDETYGYDEKKFPTAPSKPREYVSKEDYKNPTTGKTGRLIVRGRANVPTKEHEIVRLRRENNLEYLSYTQSDIAKTITMLKTKATTLKNKAQKEENSDNAKTCEFIANLLERTAEELREKQKDQAAISEITNNIAPKLESAYKKCTLSTFSEAREIGQQGFDALEKL